uniref:Plasma kallikrein n=1 Tax=Cacopsylla melanoneura TaxID=428564 RepID=A0A8D8VRP7_9HEMI
MQSYHTPALFLLFSILFNDQIPGLSCVPHDRFKRNGFPKFSEDFDIEDLFSHRRAMTCGSRNVNHDPQRAANVKIIGGTSTPYGAYPWQVEVQVRSSSGQGEHQCGGAIISDTVVLTAAHCLQGVSKSKLKVIVGKHNLNGVDKFEQTLKVEKAVLHHRFRKDGTHSNDIAVIKVRGSIGFNQYVQPICIPEHDNVAASDWCVVTGWGAQNAEQIDDISNTLRAATVKIIDQNTCRSSAVYGNSHQNILDSMLCAGYLNGGIDACGGDSGGPLACKTGGRFVLSGIVSWGDGCAKKNKPGVYTRVSYYAKWINEKLQMLQQS